eukprot:375228-Prorocentrum_lima.AAC.1
MSAKSFLFLEQPRGARANPPLEDPARPPGWGEPPPRALVWLARVLNEGALLATRFVVLLCGWRSAP